MKRNLMILVLFFFALSCKREKSKINAIPFSNLESICNINGEPVDSSVSYYPWILTRDSIFYKVAGKTFYKLRLISKEEIRKETGKAVLRDSFTVVRGSKMIETMSYYLFKMKEPVLSNYYLNKEIYRINAFRSFHKPVTFRVEKQKDKAFLFVKKINRPISYPFHINRVLVFLPPKKPGTISQKLLKEQKKVDDSIAKAEHNTNYFPEVNYVIQISTEQWDSLKVLIDSSTFWNGEAILGHDHQYVDGSTWVIEGHSQSGYQIKKILNPDFDNSNSHPNPYDKGNRYANLFKYVVQLSRLKEDWY